MEDTFISNGKCSDNKDLQNHISQLPLDCLIKVMQLTSPKDACRCAAVCTTFKSVANSNYVWGAFLPADLSPIPYHAKIDVQQLPVSKKEIYLHLYRNRIHPVSKHILKLDLLSGAKIILLQRLSILITDLRGIPTEIKGAILCKDLSPNMKYAAYIIFTGIPYEQSLEITQWIYDSSSGHVTSMYSMDIMGQKWQKRGDGWREIKLGEFNTGVGEDRVLHFSIHDTYSKYLINHIIFIGFEVRPIKETKYAE
ncbi:putative F-box protein PP2-B2 [Carex rostrata]